jgi:hypothetical protein
MPPMLDYYANAGYFVGPDGLGDKLEEVWGQTGTEMSPTQLADVHALVDKGYRAWIQADFATAAKVLTVALDAYHANPATLSRDPRNRQIMFKALVYKAAAHRRLGQTDQATSTMSELVRGYPDTPVTRSTHGPEANEFYEAVRQQLASQGRGQLTVVVDDPSAVIFLNGRYEGVGRITKTDLVPGEYRVFLQKGMVNGRLHTAVVEPNKETKLDIDWVFESSLVTGPEWVGFNFLSRDLQQKHEAEFATRVGLRLSLVNVVIHSVDAKDRRRAIAGRVLGVSTGTYPRAGLIELDPVEPSPKEVTGLAVYMTGGPPTDAVKPLETGPAPKQPELKFPSNPWPIPAWSTAAVAAGSIGVGIFFLVRDGSCADTPPPDTQCRTLNDTLLPGIGLTVAGVAIGGLSAWMFYKAAGWKRAHVPVEVKPTPGGAVVSFTGRF